MMERLKDIFKVTTSSAAPASATNNIISRDTVLEGNINAAGNLRIEGTVRGHVTSTAKVVLSPAAQVYGNLTAKNAEIAGTVHGNIDIAHLLVFRSTASVQGDLVTAKLVLEKGTVFNGKCSMLSHTTTEIEETY